MYYFILMTGEYEDRDPMIVSSDLKVFKQYVKNYIENWYAVRDTNLDYLYIPSDITVVFSNIIVNSKKCFHIWKYDYKTIDGFNKLFEDIKNYVEEK